MDHSPLSLVVVWRSAPVALFVRRTSAPAMLAPVESVTLPTASELELAWPFAEGASALMARIGATAMRSAKDVWRRMLRTLSAVRCVVGVGSEHSAPDIFCAPHCSCAN